MILVAAIAFTALAAYGWLGRGNREKFRSLVVMVTLAAAVFWVGYVLAS